MSMRFYSLNVTTLNNDALCKPKLVETSLLTAFLAPLIVAFSVASLLAKDNFFSSIYLAITSILAACLYVVYGVDAAFALVAFIYIGVVVAFTVLIAATYRYVEIRGVRASKYWIPPLVIAVALLVITVFRYASPQHLRPVEAQISSSAISAFISNYTTYVVLLAVALLIIAIGCIKIAGKVTR